MTDFRVRVVRRLEAYFFYPHFTEENSHKAYEFEMKIKDVVRRLNKNKAYQ